MIINIIHHRSSPYLDKLQANKSPVEPEASVLLLDDHNPTIRHKGGMPTLCTRWGHRSNGLAKVRSEISEFKQRRGTVPIR